MSRPASKYPTEGELEILKVLWEQGPSRLSVICHALRRNRPVATTTVASMLKIMREKGLVKRTSKQNNITWATKVSKQCTSSRLVGHLMDRIFDGSARSLIAHLLEHGGLTEKDQQAIRQMLSTKRSKSQRKREQ